MMLRINVLNTVDKPVKEREWPPPIFGLYTNGILIRMTGSAYADE
jgi:hypothetical protein